MQNKAIGLGLLCYCATVLFETALFLDFSPSVVDYESLPSDGFPRFFQISKLTRITGQVVADDVILWELVHDWQQHVPGFLCELKFVQ
jgi:hypothetical protein